MSRRDFLKLMAAAGTVMTFVPFVDWGRFLPHPQPAVSQRARAELADGTQANVATFPLNHSEVIIYPKSDDPVLNREAFRAWQLIRLPKELGGDRPDVTAFRAFSMVCLHLWCLWNYSPVQKAGACPCHASTYDPVTGKAFGGPASFQSASSNVLPRLDLEADAQGFLWILPPVWTVTGNGIVGFGRSLV